MSSSAAMKWSVRTVVVATLWAVTEGGSQHLIVPRTKTSLVTVVPVAPFGLVHSIHPSYHVEGSLHPGYNDLTSNIFDRRDFFIQHLRNKRATSYSYMTPDSSRSEKFDTYTDARTSDNHPLNRYEGSVSWKSPEGIVFNMNYVADGSGYHPTGSHLPGEPGHRSFFINTVSR